MENTIKERIKQFCKEIGISIKSFEEQSNLSNGYVNGISKAIGDEKLKTISLSFPQLNITWLLTGEGQMMNDSGNNIKGDNNNWNNVNTDAALIRAIDAISEQQKLTAKSQEQIDRLISIIEKLNS